MCVQVIDEALDLVRAISFSAVACCCGKVMRRIARFLTRSCTFLQSVRHMTEPTRLKIAPDTLCLARLAHQHLQRSFPAAASAVQVRLEQKLGLPPTKAQSRKKLRLQPQH